MKTIIFYHGWATTKEAQKTRGYILANLGYQIFIPEAIYHGERGHLDNHYDSVEIITKFWPTVINTMHESEIILNFINDNIGVPIDKIAILGNSMGGMIAAGIVASNHEIKTAVVLNGSCNWKKTNEILKKVFKVEKIKEIKILEDLIKEYDPITRLDELRYKNLLLQHGTDDELIDISPQEEFFDKIKKINFNVDFIKHKRLNHLVTTNMMDHTIQWFDEYL